MTLEETMFVLKQFGSEQTKKTHRKHGAKEPLFGVKVGDLKKLVKKIKTNHTLALSLFETGNSDAMYLAALINDDKLMDKATLNAWAKKANWYMISEYAVAWAAAESAHGMVLAKEWINSSENKLKCTGYATLTALLSYLPIEKLDTDFIIKELKKAPETIKTAENRVKYCTNNFVISCGSFSAELFPLATEIAAAIGIVKVNMGETSCKVPNAKDYIQKVEKMGRVGKLKKTARC